MMINWL